MKILVTGSSGFIGSHLIREMQDHQITSIDSRIDVRNFCHGNREKYDLVIHCAALVGGRAVKLSPVAHAINLEMDAALFQWAEKTQPGRLVYLSSCAAYPVDIAAECTPLHESDIDLSEPGLPDQLYGWAKLTGEMLAARSSVPVSVVRPFCIYGNYQDMSTAFGSFTQQVRERRDPVTIWGTGQQVRDFIHVSDVVNAILAIVKAGVDYPVNICTGTGTTLLELMQLMIKAADYTPGIEILRDKPAGLPCHVGSTDLLSKLYTPRISLPEGVHNAVTR